MPARPRTTRRLLRTGLAALLTFGLVACGGDSGDADSDSDNDGAAGASELAVDDVWARATAQGQSNGAIYLTIEGGSDGDRLTGVELPATVAARAEIHETVAADLGDDDHDDGDHDDGDHDDDNDGDHDDHGDHGAMTMRHVDEVEIPGGDTVVFEPGGYHIMLLELAAPLVAGDTIDVDLAFAEAGVVSVTAEVRGG